MGGSVIPVVKETGAKGTMAYVPDTVSAEGVGSGWGSTT